MKKETPYPIFQIGFNKCGTTSLHDFFVKNGYMSYHWDNGKIANTIKENLNSNNILKSYSKNSFFCDIECVDELIFAQNYFKELSQCYPSAKFILNTRDKNKWIKSRLLHNNKTYVYKNNNIYSELLNIKSDESFLADLWSRQWDFHIQKVKNFFNNSDKLLVFDIEKDNVCKLIDFFKDLDLNKEHWTVSNKT